MSGIRLQKYLAEAGIASRRKSELLIAEGRVEVDGVIIKTPGTRISGTEVVKVDGIEVDCKCSRLYIMLHKPVGYISSVRDQFSRKTVLDLVDTKGVRIFPVGRLDWNTSGLLLLTNDGDLAYKLTHPSFEIKKTYRVLLKDKLKIEDIRKLQNGIKIDDYTTAPAHVALLNSTEKSTEADIIIHEGKNRQVRKMFAALGYAILQLRRIAFGPIDIGDLPEGKWRYLNEEEIRCLMDSVYSGGG